MRSIDPSLFHSTFFGSNLYIPRNHKGDFYYRDRFNSKTFPYCTFCGLEPIAIVKTKREGQFHSLQAACDKHVQGEPIMLTDEQKELYQKVFIGQKGDLTKHPYVNEDGTVNRDALFKLLEELATAEFMLRARQQAVVVFSEEDLATKSDDEKNRIRLYDKTHRNKSGNEIDAEKRAKRIADGTKDKRTVLIEIIMKKRNCSWDKAVEFIEGDI